jgi:RNA ligase (TIGR02306 family)
MNKIATIQKVTNVRNHPNADSLDLCNILGWQVVIKRGEFKDGDLCVYIPIDSVLPEKPEFEFLRQKDFRIRTVKLRGQISQGICFPLSILPTQICDIKMNMLENGLPNPTFVGWTEGWDVTELVGATHYEKPLPAELVGKAIGGFPGWLRITDELNIKSYPVILDEMRGRPYYITRKDDGQSGTYFLKDGVFGVCSRKLQLADDGNGYWTMAHKYDLEARMRSWFGGGDIAVQGEVCGPGIQKNKLGLKEKELHLFNLVDSKTREYMSFEKLRDFCEFSHIPMVTQIDAGLLFIYDLPYLQNLANNLKYPNGSAAEGIVIRPMEYVYSPTTEWALSGKVVSEVFQVKHEE